MSKFEELYGKDEKELKEGKKELCLNKVKRAFGSAIDAEKGAIDDLQEVLDKARYELANGDINALNRVIDVIDSIKVHEVVLAIIIEEKKSFIG